MIRLRPAAERGHFDYGWLSTHHTFSFGRYFHPEFVRFRALRVLNEDHVQPSKGFDTHPHQDMEILTYVIDGTLEHHDSFGTGSQLKPGDVLRMSAGSGIEHSEFNASTTDPLHFFQIWVMPERKGLDPEFTQRSFPDEERRGRLRLIASQNGEEHSLSLNQDARLYDSHLLPNQEVAHSLAPERGVYLHLVHGAVKFNGHTLKGGDGAAIENMPLIELKAVVESE
ncbi:MAG TPA: pirin family protein, partial [Bacteroidetes bacterium]|nr:pirin family protein [Bacteroidota bacterium]